ncbi:MAG: DNA polymerase III subunit delta [Candidatus Omnitrophica bacterium]|nr:DNA polymerase III subunit delta [Candidatus Omnitrophota bacterium]
MSRQTVLLIGKDRFLKREIIQTLRKDTDFQEFTAGVDSLGSLLGFVNTFPFLHSKRLAVLWDLEELEDDERDRLLAGWNERPEANILVLVSDETNAKKSAFLRTLSDRCKVTPCHPPFEKDMPRWIEERVRRQGKNIEKAATLLLMEKIGLQTGLLAPAIDQAALFTQAADTITAKDVESLFGRSLTADVFELLNFLLERDFKKFIEKAEDLLSEGTRAFEILSVLSGNLERLKRVHELQAMGLTAERVGVELKIHPFFLEKVLSEARRAPMARVKAWLSRLLECDKAIKTGELSEKIAFERFLVGTALEV